MSEIVESSDAVGKLHVSSSSKAENNKSVGNVANSTCECGVSAPDVLAFKCAGT